MKRFILLLLFACISFSAYVDIVSPVTTRLNADNSVYLGVAGPGQTVKLSVAKECEGKLWDRLYILADSLPDGWSKEDGLWYESPMQASIKISPDAMNGEYTVKAMVVDEYEGLGNLTFVVKVNVSKDVFDAEVVNPTLETGVGQPGAYTLTLKNLGTASDVFKIWVTSMPAWKYTKTVVVPRDSEKDVMYEIVAGERGSYPITLHIESLSSKQIGKTMNATFKAEPSIISDLKACSHGLLLFPVPEMPIYSLLGFLSNFL